MALGAVGAFALAATAFAGGAQAQTWFYAQPAPGYGPCYTMNNVGAYDCSFANGYASPSNHAPSYYTTKPAWLPSMPGPRASSRAGE